MKNNQDGRSIIEMLGVLAVVGILSTAGILGYARAMSHIQNQKFNEQISNIPINTYSRFIKYKNYEGLNNELAIGLSIVPKSMAGENNKIYHALGGEVSIYVPGDGGIPAKHQGNAFEIKLDNVSKSGCLFLTTSSWYQGFSLIRVGISGNNANTFYDGEDFPLSPIVASDYCSCDFKENICGLIFTFL